MIYRESKNGRTDNVVRENPEPKFELQLFENE